MIQSHQVCCEVKGSVKSTQMSSNAADTGMVWNIIKCLSPELGTHTLLTSIVDGCYEVKNILLFVAIQSQIRGAKASICAQFCANRIPHYLMLIAC